MNVQQLDLLTNRAIKQGYENAEPSWRELALWAVKAVCTQGPEFTSDEVHQILKELAVAETHDTRALGGVMRQAQRFGWCEPTIYTRKSERPACHRRPLCVWRSNLWSYSV